MGRRVRRPAKNVQRQSAAERGEYRQAARSAQQGLGAMMIEPNDDDDRTNSLGLFDNAEAYRLSARVLPIRHGHADKPPRFLYCHALELYLKALLRQKHSIATVRNKFGHQIKLLVREAEALGLVVSDDDRAVLMLIDNTDAMIDSRYIRTGTTLLVRLESLRRTCKSIRDGVGAILYKNGVLVRLCPGIA
jgi:HEPN domain-containing protein